MYRDSFPDACLTCVFADPLLAQDSLINGEHEKHKVVIRHIGWAVMLR